MGETFFGRWHVLGRSELSFFFERFIVSGSENADGTFELADDGTPINLDVSGSEWKIQFEARLESTDWFPYDPDRATRFVLHQGLTVVLATPAPIKPSGLVFAHRLVVECISLDPTLSPPMSPNPFDFSLPKP
jgi:hypothetical protein